METLGVNEGESLQETPFWLSQPRIRESVDQARADITGGRTHNEQQIREEFSVPKRSATAE